MTRSLTVVLAIADPIAVLFRSRAAVIAENLFLRADHTRPWGLVFRNRFKHLSLPVTIDINCVMCLQNHPRLFVPRDTGNRH